MKELTFAVNKETTKFYFDAHLADLPQMYTSQAIYLVDENVYRLHAAKFEYATVIQVPSGEKYKTQQTADKIINELIELETHKSSILIGVGGGVTTDITGYVAGIYKRGIKAGFIPTTILAMADAAIGGKNGVDVGLYKNMVGTVNTPEFVLYNYEFLQSLPHEEWVNGFAEIIKHACIKDRILFDMLAANNLEYYQKDTISLSQIIERNVEIKMHIVQKDLHETADRKLLNFGHTLGHAIENRYQLPHGHAVSIGMAAAAKISEEINNFSSEEKESLIQLLQQYQLPVDFDYDRQQAFKQLRLDKKREGKSIDFILLNKIGDAKINSIPITQLEDLLTQTI